MSQLLTLEEGVVRRTSAAKQAEVYSAFKKNLKEALQNPRNKGFFARENQIITERRFRSAPSIERDVSPSSVHVPSTLANVSIQYANEEYIAEELMPMVSAAKLADEYPIYTKESRIAYPSDAMAARGKANEISEEREMGSFSCKPYGLKDFVDVTTLENQDAPLNEMIDLVESVQEGNLFNRELRTAAILCDSSYFGSGQYAAATTSWSTANGGSIIADIHTGLDAIWSGRGPSRLVGYCSPAVWRAMCRNPALLELGKSRNNNLGKNGLLSTADVAQIFELDDILVGKSRKNTANEGVSASLGRIWSNVFGIIRVAKSPGIRTASFGYTFRFKGRVNTRQWFDEEIGTDGGYYAQVSCHEVQKVVAAPCGYLITAPLG